ncbi:acyltransferase [Anaeromyxobacter sp. PSR-1]|uniref:acyltransferase family protein n=1 Tax=Anaeromyxobacter sp. PSR-1 TaxID=1300915 RepID=UPI0005E002A3|nr:acyltransferase [Anaeromyxobacter sp. PSR-1]GAO01357.1 putative peptidoglycan O-acetyltransferase YrhL [Anaeromyxobacter sp. PSR-1]
MPAVTPAPRRRLPDLDAVRGFAALSVLFYHLFAWGTRPAQSTGPARMLASLFRWGWLGVDVFFVLSGFLITGLLLEARQRPDYYSDFYAKRAFRILPLYYASVGVACLTVVALNAPVDWRGVFFSIGFLANTGSLLSFTLTEPFGVYWSLAVEEHFYLLWPLLVRSLPVRWLWFACAGLIVASPALRFWSAHSGAPFDIYGFTAFRLDGLALGAIFALMKHERVSRRITVGAVAALAAAGLTLGALLWRVGALSRTSELGAALQFSSTTLFIGALFLAIRSVGSRAPTNVVRVLGFFGDISFFVYLNHLTAILAFDYFWARMGLSRGSLGAELVRAFTVVGVVVVAGVLSRRYFELPVQRLRRNLGARLFAKCSLE